jgi:hypothetical protein
MGVAIGAIVVVGIESVIYAHSGPDDAMKETDKKLREALKKELGEPGQYAQSRTADDLRNLQTEATRLFGVLEAR